MNEPGTIDRILRETRTIAMVGLSESPGRASAGVAKHMQDAGYRIVPINPQIETALGERAYPDLQSASQEHAIDLVDVFRKPTYVPEVVKDVIRLKIPAIWLQLGIVHEEAAGWAEHAGVLTVMDRCLMIEHARWMR